MTLLFMRTLFGDDFNWISVFIATLAYFVLGALWYSKILFAPKWIAYNKIDVNDPNAKKGMFLMFVGSLLLMFAQCTALGILANRAGTDGAVVGGWVSGVKLGAFTGCCFCAGTMGINYLYEKKPLGLLLINSGYAIVGNIIAAIIICIIR